MWRKRGRGSEEGVRREGGREGERREGGRERGGVLRSSAGGVFPSEVGQQTQHSCLAMHTTCTAVGKTNGTGSCTQEWGVGMRPLYSPTFGSPVSSQSLISSANCMALWEMYSGEKQIRAAFSTRALGMDRGIMGFGYQLPVTCPGLTCTCPP